MEDFKELQQFVNEMKDTSSLNAKKEILANYADNTFITEVLEYTYNPYKQFHVTSKNCIKLNHLVDGSQRFGGTVFELLDKLSNRVVTGHDAIKEVNNFVLTHADYAPLIYSIIDKNLEIRAHDSVINKVIPDLIPTFDVALARSYEPKLVDFENDTWYGSRKLDGVRCIIILDKNGEAKAYSRNGKEFETLGKVLKSIEAIGSKHLVFDGELCLIDEEGNEDFQGVMKEIRKKDHTIENPQYKIFDMLPLESFGKKSGDISLGDRLKSLKVLPIDTSECLSILPQVVVRDEEHFAELSAEATEKGFEGLMLRKDVSYEGKRTKNLLKVKSFLDEEYEVVSIDFKDHRIIKEGKEVVRPMLAQAYIQHKGFRVGVGSGFSQEQRIHYYENPEELVGKTITVQYFEESHNQEGGISLRFPTVKHIYEGERDV